MASHAPESAECGGFCGDGNGEEGRVRFVARRRGREDWVWGGVGVLWWGDVDFDLVVELVVAMVRVFLELKGWRRVKIGRDAYAFFSDLDL